jgi:type I restriction enzyme, S subunit
MRTYPEYKDSGVEWIGEIPKGWEFKKLKYLFNQNRNQINENELNDKDVVHYSIPNVQEYGTGRLESGNDIQSNKFILNDIELLLSKLNPRKKTICISKVETITSVGSTEFICISPKENDIEIKYFYYLFKTDEFTDDLDSRVESVTRSHQRIQPDEFLNIGCWFPPLSEQKQISDYLNRKTDQIDDLIEKTEQKIKLLKEQRSSLINQCVTKGLDPNVEMKDSGVEWIGEIPSDWSLKKLTRICTKVRNGYVGPTREIMKEEGVKYVQGIHIKSGEIKYTPVGPYYVSPEWSYEHSETLLKEGDVLVVQTGTIGQVGYVTKEFEGSNCHALIIVRIDKEVGNGRFLLYSFLGCYVQNYLQSIKTGDILHHINTKKLRFLKVLIPPLPEQKQISDYLDRETSKIDRMVEIETKRIELFKEYRQSLVSNVVTGKIDVRDEVVQ